MARTGPAIHYKALTQTIKESEMTEEQWHMMKKGDQDAKEIHDEMVIALAHMHELQEDEYLCIGFQEHSGFEIYKNRFRVLDKTKVDVN
jgi:hypothetical protein|tara:strand:+ start:738 stop:1004 length:267 start_codon:yes stop_codon:yes gene_type:complete